MRMGAERKRTTGHAPRRQAQLLGALVCFHLAGPVMQMVASGLAVAVLFPLYILVLGSATLSMSGRHRLTLGLLALPLLTVVLRRVAIDRPEPLMLSASALPFLAYASYVVFRGVLAPGVIDRARLLGSASVFILIAQAWSSLYAGLEWVTPGSIVHAGEEGVRPSDLGYFSLVTQTTLGYGDVVPVSPIARALATLQAAAGLFYMGVVVARFAGRFELREPGSDADREG
jgi:hypothetical protein